MRKRALFAIAFVSALIGIGNAQTPAKKALDVTPGYLRFTMIQGEIGVGMNTVFSNETAPFKITKVVSPVPWITATHWQAARDERVSIGDGTNVQYRVQIKVESSLAKLGAVAEKVVVHTNSAEQPEISINVTGVIRPTFRVEPTAIDFGEVTYADTAATRTVTVRSNDLKQPGSFVVTKAESVHAELEVTLKPTDRPGEYMVTIQIRKNARPGTISGVVRISTNDRIRPIVDIPIKGTIKSVQ